MKDSYDLIVVGTGIAGLSCAIKASEQGVRVLVITKDDRLSESNTWYAQGGIVETGVGDSPDLLMLDIQKAGSFINNLDAIKIVAEDGPVLVDEFLIQKAKVPFHRTETGEFDRTQEGAHSVRRILHVKDHTGRSIEESLVAYVKNLPNVDFLAGLTAVDIITNTHHSRDPQQRYKERKVLGIYVLKNLTGEVLPVFAPSVVLAGGGIGNLYQHTSNPEGATGDCAAMAHRAGCEIINAEYIQFHPTILFHRDVKRFLITEAMRGEGAKLMNRDGKYFMQDYNPQQADLAPRDEVARAIYKEMLSEGGYVWLDATKIKHTDVSRRFPSIFEKCLSLGIDIRNDLIPVVPAAHYFCGGIKIDLNGATELSGLYAIGETACNGVHGANRLASVSLLESLVFGVRAGQDVVARAAVLDKTLTSSIPDWIAPAGEAEFDPILIQSDLASIQTTMWNYVGIVRTPSRLERAISDLNYLEHRVQKFYQQARLNREILQLRNAIVTASLIALAAYKNSNSLGCHYVQSVPANNK